MGKGGPRKVSPFFIPHGITNMASGLLGIETGFMATNYSISTACATSNFCMVSAADAIRAKRADLMLVGGAEAPMNELGLAGFIACRALSGRNDSPETASRPWDKERDGFVLGEGAGVFVLERLSHAKARGAPILVEYLGGAMTCDAHHMTEPRKDGLGVSTCIKMALADGGVDRKQVNLVNAHATSTPAGDITEIRAIKTAFDGDTDNFVIHGTKSMVGHALGAAGGLEGVALIQAIRHKQIHPTINVTTPDEELTIKAPLAKDGAMDKDIEVGISNSFGFGGQNSVIALAPYVP
jgi:3-oxoacyl-[acyl-carrier-protein] synthase II